MSTSTELDTWVDQQTRDDMRPPCDSYVGDNDERCANPAEWISTVECSECKRRHTLDCNPCHEEMLAREFACAGCGGNLTLVTSERL